MHIALVRPGAHACQFYVDVDDDDGDGDDDDDELFMSC